MSGLEHPGPPPSACPDEAVLSGFVEGTLAAAEREALEHHLRACPACWEVVALLGAVGEGAPAAAAAPRPAALLTRGTLVSRYVLLERVGAGGMGVVYAAYDPELERKVALKLLHPSVHGGAPLGAAQARLLREAKALARLSHPHVVPVFDAGTFEGRVFIVMEWVDGGTLSQWLAERPRTWREVLEVLRRAGLGLAAAHAAGIVHRDFKPDNLLMGKEGRVQVTDFGLARALQVDEPPESPGGWGRGAGAGEQALTHTGSVLGTPAYMAPEQLAGLPVDERADQFSFCVTFYEALWGERPFSGGSLKELEAAIAAQKVRPPPGRGVPAWVRRAVLQGLRASPDERHPSLEALLAELARPAGQARRRVLVGGLAALGVLACVAVPVSRAQAVRVQACAVAARSLEDVWNEATQERIRGAFLRTGVPYAANAWDVGRGALESYASLWSQVRRQSCEQSQGWWGLEVDMLASQRQECLEGAARDFSALVELLARADKTVVQNVASASRSLPDVGACLEERALERNQAQAPANPEARGRWVALRERLAAARARQQAGRHEEGLALARSAREEARAGGFARLEAELLLAIGQLQEKLGRFVEAEAALHEAALAAEQARDEQGVAWARAVLVGVVGVRQARASEGERLARYAQVALVRAGSPPEVGRYLSNNLGMLHYQQGRLHEAQEEWRRALALYESSGQAEHPGAAITWSNLGMSLVESGQYEEAITCLRRGLSMTERLLGSEHPQLAVVMMNMSTALSRQGRLRESNAMDARVLELLRRVHPADHHDVLLAMSNLAVGYAEEGRQEEAWALFARAVEGSERTRGASHPEVGKHRQSWAETLLEHGRPREALEQFRRAHAIFQAAVGERHVRTVLCLSGMGQAHLGLGEHRRAVTLLEQVLARFDPESSEPVDVGRAHFALAQALGAEPDQRGRARAEALRAQELFTQAHNTQQAQAVERWLAHPGPP